MTRILIANSVLFAFNVTKELQMYQVVSEMLIKLVMVLMISVSSLRQMTPWLLPETRASPLLPFLYRNVKEIATQMLIGTSYWLLTLWVHLVRLNPLSAAPRVYHALFALVTKLFLVALDSVEQHGTTATIQATLPRNLTLLDSQIQFGTISN